MNTEGHNTYFYGDRNYSSFEKKQPTMHIYYYKTNFPCIDSRNVHFFKIS